MWHELHNHCASCWCIWTHTLLPSSFLIYCSHLLPSSWSWANFYSNIFWALAWWKPGMQHIQHHYSCLCCIYLLAIIVTLCSTGITNKTSFFYNSLIIHMNHSLIFSIVYGNVDLLTSVKCLNNYGMDFLEILFRYSWCPADATS